MKMALMATSQTGRYSIFGKIKDGVIQCCIVVDADTDNTIYKTALYTDAMAYMQYMDDLEQARS